MESQASAACASHESDKAHTVIVHQPGMEVLLGLLHASGSLFEGPVSLEKARRDHETFVRALQSHGITVHRVRDVLALNADTNLNDRMELEACAREMLEYVFHPLGNPAAGHEASGNNPSDQEKHLLSPEYKQTCFSVFSTNDLIDTILMRPSVHLERSMYHPLALESIQTRPLSNLIFTRDQQITTRRGVVIANLKPLQRNGSECKLMEAVFKKLGIQPLGHIKFPGYLEGGDFFPMGADLCLIGTGVRTNEEAVRQLMENDWLGTRRVAVVRDLFDRSQQRMHLDTIFNVASEDVVVLLEPVMGSNSSIRRLVTEYTRNENSHQYEVTRRDVEFAEYLRAEGYHIVPFSDEDQRRYGINFINLGNNTIISVDEPSARKLLSDDHFAQVNKGKIQVIDFSGITSLYGSAHCASQVLRLPDEAKEKRLEAARLRQSACASVITRPPQTSRNLSQSTSRIMMHAPAHFGANVEAASTNAFIKVAPKSASIESNARSEFAQLHAKLREAGIDVLLFGEYDGSVVNPDEVFPNNWFTTHQAGECQDGAGRFVLYPMQCVSRRTERKENIIIELRKMYPASIDLASVYESHPDATRRDLFLEGTGSLVLDRMGRVAFACVSPRTNPDVAQDWCTQLGYNRLVTFRAVDSKGKPIYHTNVVMAVGTRWAVLGTEAIPDAEERSAVLAALREGGHTVIELSSDQLDNFCGNCIELCAPNGDKILALSKCAWDHFTDAQKQLFLPQSSANGKGLVDRVIFSDIPTIEKHGGGSVRCMIAELF